MTNTTSRTPEGLDELRSWDDADALANQVEQLEDAKGRGLAVYGFHSDQRTLVGLGPVERRRRARESSDVPYSQRVPQSEPPGPFIAGDDEDGELLRALRARKVRPWAVALPGALVVAAAAVVAVRAFAPQAPAAKLPAAAAKAPAAAVTANARAAAVAANARGAAATLPAAASDGAASQTDTASAEPPVEADRRPEDSAEPEPRKVEAARAGQAEPLAAAVVEGSNGASKEPFAPKLPLPAPVDGSIAGAKAPVGSLNVTSNPPANVVLDGRPIGQAPRVVQVSPGTHTVLFIHPLYGRKLLNVNVSAGRASSAAANF